MRPSNPQEWSTYIAGLSGQPLFSQVVAANTHSFARSLVAEGATMGDVEQILLLLVRQLRATGTKVPREGPFDLVTMALTDPIARRGPSMSEAKAELMADSYETLTDDVDLFLLEARVGN